MRVNSYWMKIDIGAGLLMYQFMKVPVKVLKKIVSLMFQFRFLKIQFFSILWCDHVYYIYYSIE